MLPLSEFSVSATVSALCLL